MAGHASPFLIIRTSHGVHGAAAAGGCNGFVRSLVWSVCVASIAAAALPGRLHAKDAGGAHWALDFLRDELGLHAEEVARVAAGEPVVRMVEDPGVREIAVLAAMPLPPGVVAWSADYAGVERLRRVSPDFLAMGRLGRPPTAAELQAIELEPRTVSQLSRCRQERCALNAAREDIERYVTAARSDDPTAAAHRAFREVLRHRLTSYQDGGDTTLPVLANRRWMLTTADAPSILLARRPSLAQLAPALDARLRIAGPRQEDVYYWLREKMWRREVVGLYHGVFDDARRADGGRRRVLAEKLVYANHYLLGSLAVTGILEDASGTYLFFLNRSETDNRGPFSVIERALANRLIGGRLRRQVTALRDSLAPSATLNARSDP